MVHHTDAHVQELALAGDVVICHGGFYHMAGTVHLVVVHHGPALVQARQGIIGIDVAVLQLGGGELVDPLVALGFQGRVGADLERVGHALQRLVDVGIVEEDAGMLPLPLRRILEIADAAGLVLYLVDADSQGDLLVAPEPGRPEAVLYADFGEVHRIDQFPGGSRFPAAGSE